MFKGGSIITTAIFAWILVPKKTLGKKQFFGGSLAVLGITIVGIVGAWGKTGADNSPILGYTLMLASLAFNGFLYAIQQRYLHFYKIGPLTMIGFQGTFGLLIVGLVTIILSNVQCGFGTNVCVYGDDGQAWMVSWTVYWRQVTTNWFIPPLILISTASLATYNLNGVRITKLFDSIARSLLNITKTLVIWFIGLLVTIITNQEIQQLKLQELGWSVNLGKAVGFVGIIAGTLVYNGWGIKKKRNQVVVGDNNNDSNNRKLKEGKNDVN